MKFKNRLTRLLSILLIITMSLLAGCSEDTPVSSTTTETNNENVNIHVDEDKIEDENPDTPVSNEEDTEDIGEETKQKNIKVSGDLEVHYIDVDQGDAILIKQNDKNMLIDAGDNAYGDRVVNYLKSNNVTRLDYVIGTHPHADHIGGMDDVINKFDIGKVIMPQVNHTTKTFEDVITAIQNKGLRIITPKVGDTYELGDASFTILAPNSNSYSNLNDYSVITKLVYGTNSFMFTGDAEVEAERETVNNGQSLKSDVLKVGHHGSDTSTTPEFLNAVDPKYAVIQSGKSNKYGHPVESTLTKLQNKNIEVYRNDLSGNVIATSDGNIITFNTNPSEGSPKQATAPPKTEPVEEQVISDETNEEQYIGNKNSKIFHLTNCSSLPNESNRSNFDSKDEAINSGYRACKICKP